MERRGCFSSRHLREKTGSTNLRLGYAAGQLIFNWERDRTQLRVDGGPAGGRHKFGAGVIPVNKYVLIRWLLTPKKQSVFVDGQLRFEHSGDFSRLDNPVRVFSAAGSEVTVKSIKVKQASCGDGVSVWARVLKGRRHIFTAFRPACAHDGTPLRMTPVWEGLLPAASNTPVLCKPQLDGVVFARRTAGESVSSGFLRSGRCAGNHGAHDADRSQSRLICHR